MLVITMSVFYPTKWLVGMQRSTVRTKSYSKQINNYMNHFITKEIVHPPTLGT